MLASTVESFIGRARLMATHFIIKAARDSGREDQGTRPSHPAVARSDRPVFLHLPLVIVGGVHRSNGIVSAILRGQLQVRLDECLDLLS